MNLKGKRLLHLGAAEFQMPAIECAKELGCYVITADNRPHNPGHRISDATENVSTVDMEDILQVAKDYNIHGIMTYGSDVATPTVCYVTQHLGLPGNPLTAAETLHRKDKFRSFQAEIGLPHPNFIAVRNLNDARERISELSGKIVVKPADSSGSKGQTVISSRNELEKAFEFAQPFSRCGIIVLEEFLPSDMLELDGDVLVKNGRLAFRHYGHNYFMKNSLASVPCGEIFPGYFSENVTKVIDKQIEKIISALGIRMGCMNFDAILSNKTVNMLDIGLRNGGNYVPELIKSSTGFDLTRAAVLSALGIDFPCHAFAASSPKPVASYILGSRCEGRFEGFDIGQGMEKYVTGSKLFSEIDSNVLPFTRGDHALGIVFFGFPDMDTMKNKMEKVEKYITLRILPSNVPIGHQDRGGEPGREYEYKRYAELQSTFIRSKLVEADRNGDKTVKRVLSRQFLESNEEKTRLSGEDKKHYEAGILVKFKGTNLRGIERLYEKVIVVELLLQCIAHCRHCLRRNYDPFHQKKEDLARIAEFIGTAPVNKGLKEILVTGGDPFLVPDRLLHFLNGVTEYAPEINVVRIASRLPVQQPDWISGKLLSVLSGKYPFRLEVATQVNHAVELFPEVVKAFEKLLKTVDVVYNQPVLLAGVNDTIEELIDLCGSLREIGIENHYIFHCVPIEGMSSFRVPLDRAIRLIHELTSSGRISGRSKPVLTVMTSIGKITLYEGSILKHRKNKYLIQSHYSFEDRLRWNPKWILPKNAEIDENGLLRVWYEDK